MVPLSQEKAILVFHMDTQHKVGLDGLREHQKLMCVSTAKKEGDSRKTILKYYTPHQQTLPVASRTKNLNI
jgi:hypothetical protein